jgi:hypothetical protein
MNEPIQLLSLGAGVQSSTMALMAAHGEITPMPKAAIFADTEAEPASVYKWLTWLEKQLPFPVHRVTAGSLEKKTLEMRTTMDGRKVSKSDIPIFTRNEDGSQGKVRHRACTADFKIHPILKLARKLGEIKRGQKTIGVIQWIGISLDEVTRMKPSREKWAESRWPLVELRMRRYDCLRWMESHGYPTPPRSACVFCPFHNDKEWLRLKREEPVEFERAAQFERDLQAAKANSDNFRTTPFLHRSLKPLSEVEFKGDGKDGQLNLFENECEGMCGV